jgi:hypothetical protein
MYLSCHYHDKLNYSFLLRSSKKSTIPYGGARCWHLLTTGDILLSVRFRLAQKIANMGLVCLHDRDDRVDHLKQSFLSIVASEAVLTAYGPPL